MAGAVVGTVVLAVVISLAKPVLFVRYFVGILPTCCILLAAGAITARTRVLGAVARERGGHLFYWESADGFAELAGRVLELGYHEVGVYYPVDAQRDAFERIVGDVLPVPRAGERGAGAPGPRGRA